MSVMMASPFRSPMINKSQFKTKDGKKFGSKKARNSPLIQINSETPSDASKYIHHTFNPLTAINKESVKKHQASINWHEYAELRKPYLPSIFTREEQTNQEEKPVPLDKSKKKHKHHKS